MNKKKVLGIGLLGGGTGLFFSQQISSITGFAVSSGIVEVFSWLKFLGIGIMVGGILLLAKGGLEGTLDNSQKSHLELKRLGAVYRYMEKKKLPGTYSPETVGKSVSQREIYGLLKDTERYVHEYFPNTLTEVVIAGSISRAKGGRRTAIKRAWTKETSMPKEIFDSNEEGIPSDLHYLSDLDVAIVNPKLFDYIVSKWPESRAIAKYSGDTATVNIDTSHLIYGRAEPEIWRSMPADIKQFIEKIAKKEYAGRQRPIELKFMRDKTDLAGIDKYDSYKIKNKSNSAR